MLGINRIRGESTFIRTPAGDVEVLILAVNSRLQTATLETKLPPAWQSAAISPQVLKLQEHFTITTTAGPIGVHVIRFQEGPSGKGYSVRIGIDAPRDWPIRRDDMKAGPPK